MAIEGLVDNTLLENLIKQVSSMTTLFQAIGGLIIAYIIFNIINLILNRKKQNEFKRMRKLLESIDKKLDRVKIIKKSINKK